MRACGFKEARSQKTAMKRSLAVTDAADETGNEPGAEDAIVDAKKQINKRDSAAASLLNKNEDVLRGGGGRWQNPRGHCIGH